jgi:glutathione S-transferase
VPITFYYGSGSPFAWRVWLALEAKAVPYELKALSFSAGDLRTPEFAALNPRRKVPVIVDEDFALYESAAILEYLDERFPDAPRLFPGDLRQRAVARRLVLEADLYFAGATDPLLDQLLFRKPEQWDLEAIAKGREGFVKEAARWETLIAGDWVAGPGPGAADFTLYPHAALLLRMDRRKPDLDLPAIPGPVFRAWMARVEALPFFAGTVPPHWR